MGCLWHQPPHSTDETECNTLVSLSAQTDRLVCFCHYNDQGYNTIHPALPLHCWLVEQRGSGSSWGQYPGKNPPRREGGSQDHPKPQNPQRKALASVCLAKESDRGGILESVCLTLVHRGVEAARGSAGVGDDDVRARVRVREVVVCWWVCGEE